MTAAAPYVSVVIPLFNEVESLRLLYQEIKAALDEELGEGRTWEVVFVDDGSKDGSWEVVADLAKADARVRGIRFRRNFGKAAGLQAGFNAARGAFLMTLDADLQDDPREIVRFLKEMEKGYDVVSGYKQRRHDPWHKVYPSRVFNWMVSTLTGVKLHDHNCGVKCYRREVVQEVRLYGELHRFVPVLAAARGFRVGELVVNHRARKFGHSKYGVIRIVKGFLDLFTVAFLTGYGQRPQHILGTAGLAFFGLGALGLVYLSIYWVVSQIMPGWNLTPLHDRPLVIYSVAALLFGGQLMSVGLIAEMITWFTMRDEQTFSIKEQTPPAPPSALGAQPDSSGA